MTFLKNTAVAFTLGATGFGGAASADVVHLDDVIIDGSLCVGQDCVNGEAFGFDTIRLKENNVRIKFDDTSASASFPNRDWQLTANDSANGGANKFSIDDITGGRTPFTIVGNAPNNALFVDAAGRLGLGTATPSVEIHSKNGDSPTLRLEQDGSSGFGVQTWDVAGNEANFFIRDVTNGSTLPFRIQPGAPSSAIYIASTGNIGLGTTSPDAALDVEGNDGTTGIKVSELSSTTAGRTMLTVANNGGSFIRMENSNTGSRWVLAHDNSADGNFAINKNGGNNEFVMDTAGNVTLAGTITTAAGGMCAGGCDRVFDTNYDLPTIEDHAQAMWSNSYLPNVGPTDETGPINVTEKVGKMLNELEHAHIYIDQLNDRIKALETALLVK